MCVCVCVYLKALVFCVVVTLKVLKLKIRERKRKKKKKILAALFLFFLVHLSFITKTKLSSNSRHVVVDDERRKKRRRGTIRPRISALEIRGRGSFRIRERFTLDLIFEEEETPDVESISENVGDMLEAFATEEEVRDMCANALVRAKMSGRAEEDARRSEGEKNGETETKKQKTFLVDFAKYNTRVRGEDSVETDRVTT